MEYNRPRSYDHRINPFGFLQSLTPAITIGGAIKPIAPMEYDTKKCRTLPWTDFVTGKPVRIDWNANCEAGTLAPLMVTEYIARYANHPEAKSADKNGNPADEHTVGLLHRLRLRIAKANHIGKEVDRLDEDSGSSLIDAQPSYLERDDDSLKAALCIVAKMPRRAAALAIEISERRLQDILHGRSAPRRKATAIILRVAKEIR